MHSIRRQRSQRQSGARVSIRDEAFSSHLLAFQALATYSPTASYSYAAASDSFFRDGCEVRTLAHVLTSSRCTSSCLVKRQTRKRHDLRWASRHDCVWRREGASAFDERRSLRARPRGPKEVSVR
eukprot:3823360-Pleurochrysis_carterae.AAC.3